MEDIEKHYQILDDLGEGTFSVVRLSIHKMTGEKVAIKILDKNKIKGDEDFERMSREIRILRKLRHPFLIQLYEIFESEQSLYFVTEYADGGELYDHIVNNRRLQEAEACHFFDQLIKAVIYLHEQGIAHRDIKPENILLDQNHDIKLIDFGLGKIYEQGEELKTACGSPCYAAPEMVARQNYQGSKIDTWSSGITLFAMVCGFLPFDDENLGKLYSKILLGEFQIPGHVSSDCQDLLKRILVTNPNDRISLQQIADHPWMKIKYLFRLPRQPVSLVQLTQIDEEILHIIELLGVPAVQARQHINQNNHNPVTTMYFLMLKKKMFNKPDFDKMNQNIRAKFIKNQQIQDQRQSGKVSEQKQQAQVQETNAQRQQQQGPEQKSEGQQVQQIRQNVVIQASDIVKNEAKEQQFQQPQTIRQEINELAQPVINEQLKQETQTRDQSQNQTETRIIEQQLQPQYQTQQEQNQNELETQNQQEGSAKQSHSQLVENELDEDSNQVRQEDSQDEIVTEDQIIEPTQHTKNEQFGQNTVQLQQKAQNSQIKQESPEKELHDDYHQFVQKEPSSSHNENSQNEAKQEIGRKEPRNLNQHNINNELSSYSLTPSQNNAEANQNSKKELQTIKDFRDKLNKQKPNQNCPQSPGTQSPSPATPNTETIEQEEPPKQKIIVPKIPFTKPDFTNKTTKSGYKNKQFLSPKNEVFTAQDKSRKPSFRPSINNSSMINTSVSTRINVSSKGSKLQNLNSSTQLKNKGRQKTNAPVGNKRNRKLGNNTLELSNDLNVEMYSGPASLDAISNKKLKELYNECYQLFKQEKFLIKRDLNCRFVISNQNIKMVFQIVRFACDGNQESEEDYMYTYQLENPSSFSKLNERQMLSRIDEKLSAVFC